MSDIRGPDRFAGVSLAAAGLLWLVREILEVGAGPLPRSGDAIVGWAEANFLSVALANETLVIGAAALVPALPTLARRLWTRAPNATTIGIGALACVVPVAAVTGVFHGRLVYPVYGLLARTPESAELVFALFVGGLHVVRLAVAVGALALARAMHRAGGFGASCVWLGVASGILVFVASYPDQVGPVVTLLAQATFAAWCVAVGVVLARDR